MSSPSQKPSPPSAIAFDFAGTLTTAERCRPNGALVRRVLTRIGSDVGPEFATSFDSSMWRYYTESLPDSLERLVRATAARHGVRLLPLETLLDEIWRECGDHPIDPDAADAVRAQHAAGRTTVLASNTCRPPERRRATLAAAGLDCMRVVCSSDVKVAAAKPFDRFYQQVIEAAEAPAREIVFVGDRLDKDVIGPCNAGMRAVLVDSRRPPTAAPECLVDGTFVISRLAQLIEVIE
ncbi:HAD family hydrolase [Streptomyces sp. NPDC059743]|uniref:HAD family hydrolase n=1 Tax=Streptomyces sp. NPDC059743 TaxID=3346928 RepID=UPI00366A3596